MKSILNRAFGYGALCGTLIMGLAVCFLMDEGFESNRDSQKLIKGDIISNVPRKKILLSEKIDKPENEHVRSERTTAVFAENSNENNFVDTVSGGRINGPVDSLVTDSHLLVRKDVLMRSMAFELPFRIDTLTIIDSLAHDLNIVTQVNHVTYHVELWESPLGFSGYKTSGNKIMIFGMDTILNFELFRENDLITLKAGNNSYHIEEAMEFKKLKHTN